MSIRKRSRCASFICAIAAVSLLLSFCDGAGAIASSDTHQQGSPTPTLMFNDQIGPVDLSSPTVARLDGVLAVLVGSENGLLYAVSASTGRRLPGWPRPVELEPGKRSAIESSPTVAYLDGPNRPPTILIGAGSVNVPNQQGGLVAFWPDGRVRFRFHTKDLFDEWNNNDKPDGYDEAVESTVAVGDLTGNGTSDIVFGSFDHELYALTAQGTLLHGFPVEMGDTVWSSAAIAKIRPGLGSDIFIGSDSTGVDGCFGGFLSDFSYVNGAARLEWRRCLPETIQSSPALGQVGPHGSWAVFVGTGFGVPPPYGKDEDLLYGFDALTGTNLRGWPVPTAGPTFGSPAIGRLVPKGPVDIVDESWCPACGGGVLGESEVFAWTSRGQLLFDQQLLGGKDLASPILGDLTGSGVNDVLIGSSQGLYALDGSNGTFLEDPLAEDIGKCPMQNAPTLAVVAKQWRLFVACGGSIATSKLDHLFAITLMTPKSDAAPWPTWRGNAANTGVISRQLLTRRR